jgi:Flp pilus assembly protein TadG
MLAVILSSIEIGRVWLTYNTTQNATLDAVITASQNNSTAAGLTRLEARLAQANIPIVNRSLVAVSNNTGYQATVTVNYVPLFGGVSLPTPGGAIAIIPSKFPITFNSTPYLAVY